MLHAVVMAGGSGTRFWPQSRRALPKQLLRIAGDETMIQATVSRTAAWIPSDRTWIVTNQSQSDETHRQLPDILSEHLIAEPCGRNTAPCIGLAAVRLLNEDPDAVMLVMPADHLVQPPDVFRETVGRAESLVARNPGSLVLFGVKPTYPAEVYGYIQRRASLEDDGSYRVEGFREKPDRNTAEQYLTDGNYYWNSGIFVWRADQILERLEEFEPEIHERLQRLAESLQGDRWESTVRKEFPAMKSISIDYAVLERAENVRVLEAPFEWDDVGSWQAVTRLLGTDGEGNTIDGPFCGLDTQDCIVRTTEDHLIATIGMENCIVVHTPDATLIARKDDEEAVRRLVKLIEERGYERFL